MTRRELEHAIRAACDVSDEDEVIVFGSQAILGQHPDAPAALRQSMEARPAPAIPRPRTGSMGAWARAPPSIAPTGSTSTG